MNEGLKEVIEAAFRNEIENNSIRLMVNPFELKNLLNLMLQREDELLRRIKALEAQDIVKLMTK